MSSSVYVGIDISKHRVDVATEPATPPTHFPQTEAGIGALVTHLQPLGPALIVLEATGGFETAVNMPIAVQYDATAADTAWQRTMTFFKTHLG